MKAEGVDLTRTGLGCSRRQRLPLHQGIRCLDWEPAGGLGPVVTVRVCKHAQE
jgi:hypothetical protein